MKIVEYTQIQIINVNIKLVFLVFVSENVTINTP